MWALGGVLGYFSPNTQDTLRYVQSDLPSHSDGEHSEGDRNLVEVETAFLC